jgi:hypothetical protein
LLQYFPTMFFLFFIMIFFSKLYLSILFFNIELTENYNYNKVKSCGESTVTFLTKHCELLQCLLIWFFSVMIFFKIIIVDFTGKSIVVFLTKYCGLLHYFPSWVFYLFFSKLSLLVFFNIELVDSLTL